MSSSRCRQHERLHDGEERLEAKRLLDPSIGAQRCPLRRRRFTSGNDDSRHLGKVRVRQESLADVVSAQASRQGKVQQDQAELTRRCVEDVERLLAGRYAGRVITMEIEQLKQTLPHIAAIFDNED
jgi:hypothetical protein